MRNMMTRVTVVLSSLAILAASTAWAGNPGQSEKPKKKVGFFQKIGRAIKATGAKITNGIMDTHVVVKKKVTGKKNRVWVCGHYTKSGNYVKGHWRVMKHSGAGGQGGNPGQGDNPGQGTPSTPPAEPPAPTTPPAGGDIPAPPTPPAGGDVPTPPTPPAGGDTPTPPSDGDSGQGQQGKPTFSGLVNDLVDITSDLDAVQAQVVSAKKKKAKNVKDLEEDYQSVNEERDQAAGKVVKIVTKDLDDNDGKAGKYFTSFVHNTKKMGKPSRESISDVTEKIRSNVRHNTTKSGKANAYKDRAKDLKDL